MHLSHVISQEQYRILSLFLVHLCKMIISPGRFLIFSNFWFFVLLVGKRAKSSPKWQKLLSVVLHVSGTIHYIIVIYGTLLYLQGCFHLLKILIMWVVRGVKSQKMVQNEKKICVSHSISQVPYIIWFSFMVHMSKMMFSGVFP